MAANKNVASTKTTPATKTAVPVKTETSAVKKAAPVAEKKEEVKAAAKKAVEAVKEEGKAVAKKAAEAKKTVEKKAATAKKTVKKEVTIDTHVQFAGKDYSEKEIYAVVKKDFQAHGNKVGDIKNVALYVKPEEAKAYYVINGSFAGDVDL